MTRCKWPRDVIAEDIERWDRQLAAMKCGHCAISVNPSTAVILNNQPLHVGCFGQALRKIVENVKKHGRDLADEAFTVDVSRVAAPIAYELGAETVRVLKKGRKS